MSNNPQSRSRHHRKPKSKGGDTSQRNISIVRRCEHQSWHNLFGAKSPEQIVWIINQKWLDPDYEFVCIKK